MFDQQSECEIECQTENEGENETIILPSEPHWSGDIQQYKTEVNKLSGGKIITFDELMQQWIEAQTMEWNQLKGKRFCVFGVLKRIQENHKNEMPKSCCDLHLIDPTINNEIIITLIYQRQIPKWINENPTK